MSLQGKVRIKKKALKSSFPVKSCYPNQLICSQKRHACLISMESPVRDTDDLMGRRGVAVSSPGPSFTSGALSLSSFTHLPKGVELYIVLQVNFKAQSVFRKVLQDSRWHDNAQFPLSFGLCYRVLYDRSAG